MVAVLLCRFISNVMTDCFLYNGRITGALKTARIAEVFHTNCELHITIFYSLELVNLHLNGTVQNSTYFELLWPSSFCLRTPIFSPC